MQKTVKESILAFAIMFGIVGACAVGIFAGIILARAHNLCG